MNVSRRDFLKGGATLGGLAASSALPAFADDSALFPRRGRFERLSIVSQHVKACASKPFAVLHISGVTFDRLMFSAKTQTQLNAILGAFPATTPVSIDSTGLTENMVIPETYPNVFVKTVPGVTSKRTTSGFMIIFK